MHFFRHLPMNFLNNWTLVFACVFGLTFNSIAQTSSAASLYNKAFASIKGKDYEAGYPQIEEALKAAEAEGNEKVIGLAKKNGAKAAYNLANIKRKAKAYDEALTLYSRGIELSPNYSSNYLGKAQALEGQGNKIDALKAYLVAGEMSEKAGKAEYAAKYVKKAGSIVGKFYSAKDYDQAMAAGKAHLALKETHTVHYYLAKSAEKQKDNATASTHINKAVSLSEASGTAVPDKYYWAQGNILEATGKKSDATAAYKKITSEKYKANADYKIKELGGK